MRNDIAADLVAYPQMRIICPEITELIKEHLSQDRQMVGMMFG